MTLTLPFPAPNRRLSAFALTVALHMVLLWGWRISTEAIPPDTAGPVDRIQWLLDTRVEPVPTARAKPEPSATAAAREEPRATSLPQPIEAPVMEAGPSPDAEPTDAAPSPSVLDRARLAIGAIDRELQEEGNTGTIRAKPVTAQMRLARGMQRAHDMAPNKWYEAPKVTEIIDPGGYSRRRYRVVGARSEYCITIESNHAPDGIDTIQHGIKPKLTNCDPDEQAATKQDW
jgi:hypothetical protein